MKQPNPTPLQPLLRCTALLLKNSPIRKKLLRAQQTEHLQQGLIEMT